jgi:hypothetical protein
LYFSSGIHMYVSLLFWFFVHFFFSLLFRFYHTKVHGNQN